jgi:purine catabolism regulator
VDSLVSLKDVLRLDVFAQARVLAGGGVLDKRPVSGISVIEMPVENFVRKHEFTLTTGMGCASERKLMSMIAEVETFAPSAFALAVGCYVEKIPSKAIQYCEERQFPLIELPWDLRFGDVIQAVSDITIARRYEKAGALQREIFQLMLQRVTLADICTHVEGKYSLPIAIADARGIIRATSATLRNVAGDLERELATAPRGETEWTISHHGRSFLCRSISVSGRTCGALIVPVGNISTRLQFEIPHVADQLAVAVAAWFLQERVVLETESRLRDDFVFELAQGEIRSRDEAISKASLLGYDLTVPYVCIVGQIDGDEPDVDHAALARIATAAQSRALVAHRQEHLIIFLEMASESSLLRQRAVNGFLHAVTSNVQALGGGSTISWGIGRYHPEGLAFHTGYREARTALRIGRVQKGPGHSTDYSSTGLYRVLGEVTECDDVASVVSETLAPLIAYEREKAVDLVGTLSTYLRTQGNISESARILSLHRQSLSYRLEKVESLTSRSLVDPDDRFLLQLCLELYRLEPAIVSQSADAVAPAKTQ